MSHPKREIWVTLIERHEPLHNKARWVERLSSDGFLVAHMKRSVVNRTPLTTPLPSF